MVRLKIWFDSNDTSKMIKGALNSDILRIEYWSMYDLFDDDK